MNAQAQYAAVQDLSADQLVEEHAELVKRIAAHLKGRLPVSVEMDDLVQVGLVALLEAARKFTSDRGADFTTYAGIRIRGAMLDEVRAMGWVPRSVHRNQRQLSEAMRTVENKCGREARPSEVADAMGVSLDEYHRMVGDAAAGKLISLDQLVEDGDSRADELNDGQLNPVGDLQSVELKTTMAMAIRGLPEREAMVLALYYDEDLNLKEIGQVLGVSESRVCQIHGQALVRLRARMGTSMAQHAA